MDRGRTAAALLALAACIVCSSAAPTANNQTALEIPEGPSNGCYYNFQHYGEGDRIMTNEPCLNCTCHNRMLMCYLRVCPFTKPIGQDCTVEKRADQCCPIVTCPDVPVDLLTSTSTTSPAEYGTTGLGKMDKYGCSISGKYFPEGAKVPPSPNKPCEHCYCIRNMTTCVMQECTLHVDGCTPIYHKDVCCPVRYSCDHPEDEIPLLDDMTTTVRPTPGFLLTTTTVQPVTQATQDCIHDDQIFADGALIKTEKACEHCYCMKGDIVCVVQECGTPMENEGKNCTSLQPRPGQCCPDTYICEGDELSTEMSIEPEEPTTVPPRRFGVEGSGYRNEPDEPFTEIHPIDTDIEGSGEDHLIHTPMAEIPLFEKVTPEMSETTTINNKHEFSTEPDKGQNTVPDILNEDIDEFKKTTVLYQKPEEPEKSTSVDPSVFVTTEKHHILPAIVDVTSSEGLITTTSPALATFEEDITTKSNKIPEESHTLDEVTLKEDNLIAEKEQDALSTLSFEKTTTQKIEHAETSEAIFIKESTTSSSLYEFQTTDIVTPGKDLVTSVHDLSLEINTTPKEGLTTVETTSINPIENEIQEPVLPIFSPGRIPGEGDCLLNSKTYQNNSIVPSTNNCHTNCRCISSIIKCDPIKCSAPPEYMNDCQPIYDSPDSCCPTYICNTKETIPPESHNQMSGTDKTKPVSENECNTSDCLSVENNKQPITSDCSNNECSNINKDCTGSGCQATPCEGNACAIHTHEKEPDLQQPNLTEINIQTDCENGICQNKPHSQCSGTECTLIETVPSTINPISESTVYEHQDHKSTDLSHTSDVVDKSTVSPSFSSENIHNEESLTQGSFTNTDASEIYVTVPVKSTTDSSKVEFDNTAEPEIHTIETTKSVPTVKPNQQTYATEEPVTKSDETFVSPKEQTATETSVATENIAQPVTELDYHNEVEHHTIPESTENSAVSKSTSEQTTIRGIEEPVTFNQVTQTVISEIHDIKSDEPTTSNLIERIETTQSPVMYETDLKETTTYRNDLIQDITQNVDILHGYEDKQTGPTEKNIEEMYGNKETTTSAMKELATGNPSDTLSHKPLETTSEYPISEHELVTKPHHILEESYTEQESEEHKVPEINTVLPVIKETNLNEQQYVTEKTVETEDISKTPTEISTSEQHDILSQTTESIFTDRSATEETKANESEISNTVSPTLELESNTKPFKELITTENAVTKDEHYITQIPEKTEDLSTHILSTTTKDVITGDDNEIRPSITDSYDSEKNIDYTTEFKMQSSTESILLSDNKIDITSTSAHDFTTESDKNLEVTKEININKVNEETPVEVTDKYIQHFETTQTSNAFETSTLTTNDKQLIDTHLITPAPSLEPELNETPTPLEDSAESHKDTFMPEKQSSTTELTTLIKEQDDEPKDITTSSDEILSYDSGTTANIPVQDQKHMTEMQGTSNINDIEIHTTETTIKLEDVKKPIPEEFSPATTIISQELETSTKPQSNDVELNTEISQMTTRPDTFTKQEITTENILQEIVTKVSEMLNIPSEKDEKPTSQIPELFTSTLKETDVTIHEENIPDIYSTSAIPEIITSEKDEIQNADHAYLTTSEIPKVLTDKTPTKDTITTDEDIVQQTASTDSNNFMPTLPTDINVPAKVDSDSTVTEIPHPATDLQNVLPLQESTDHDRNEITTEVVFGTTTPKISDVPYKITTISEEESLIPIHEQKKPESSAVNEESTLGTDISEPQLNTGEDLPQSMTDIPASHGQGNDNNKDQSEISVPTTSAIEQETAFTLSYEKLSSTVGPLSMVTDKIEMIEKETQNLIPTTTNTPHLQYHDEETPTRKTDSNHYDQSLSSSEMPNINEPAVTSETLNKPIDVIISSDIDKKTTLSDAKLYATESSMYDYQSQFTTERTQDAVISESSKDKVDNENKETLQPTVTEIVEISPSEGSSLDTQPVTKESVLSGDVYDKTTTTILEKEVEKEIESQPITEAITIIPENEMEKEVISPSTPSPINDVFKTTTTEKEIEEQSISKEPKPINDYQTTETYLLEKESESDSIPVTKETKPSPEYETTESTLHEKEQEISLRPITDETKPSPDYETTEPSSLDKEPEEDSRPVSKVTEQSPSYETTETYLLEKESESDSGPVTKEPKPIPDYETPEKDPETDSRPVTKESSLDYETTEPSLLDKEPEQDNRAVTKVTEQSPSYETTELSLLEKEHEKDSQPITKEPKPSPDYDTTDTSLLEKESEKDSQPVTKVPESNSDYETTEPALIEKLSTEKDSQPTTIEPKPIYDYETTEALLEKEPERDSQVIKETSPSNNIHETTSSGLSETETDKHVESVTQKLPDSSSESIVTIKDSDVEITTLAYKLPESPDKTSETTEFPVKYSETTPYYIELQEHTHQSTDDLSSKIPIEEQPTTEHYISEQPERGDQSSPMPDKYDSDNLFPTTHTDDVLLTTLKDENTFTAPTYTLPPHKEADAIYEITTKVDDELVTQSSSETPKEDVKYTEPTSELEKSSSPIPETEQYTEKIPKPEIPSDTIAPIEEFIKTTSVPIITKPAEEYTPHLDESDKYSKPEEKPIETPSSTEIPKPELSESPLDDDLPSPDFPPSGAGGYGQEPDYGDSEDQAFGPGTCRYGGKVYVSAQQIPRDDPCDFCFCFRSDIICLQQSCPPPIHGCHEEPIQGFCCPRYECPVSMATTLNVTTTTTTTTTTLPPHFLPHAYKGAAQRKGCQIKGHTYRVGEVVRASSGPCLHCTCGGDGQMKCDPKACTPEPMLRQMIAAAVSSKRRR